MPDETSDGRSIVGRDAVEHLLLPPTGTCWWCQERPATTGEHKFKAADLTRMLAESGPLIWGDGDGAMREIKGKSGIKRDRYRVIKFPKSLCAPCNNDRSQPFDRAYDTYSSYLGSHQLRAKSGVDFEGIFGTDWRTPLLNLARYYAKHFGCRMVNTGLPVPRSLRDFLDGATNMPDAHMALITTDTVHQRFEDGMSISPDFAEADKTASHFERYVLAAYVGSVGVRYEWRREGAERSQFFHHPYPVINRFENEVAVCEGRTYRPGCLGAFLRRPSRSKPRNAGEGGRR
jgi:hypothetical protein